MRRHCRIGAITAHEKVHRINDEYWAFRHDLKNKRIDTYWTKKPIYRMSVELLHEYIEVMVEKIRSEKNSGIMFGPKFDFKQFKALEYIKHLNLYANAYLEMVGQGSSRATYILSSRYVLKIAVNNKGLAQNEAEVAAYTNPQTKPVIAKIQDFDPDYKWLVSELVRPLAGGKNWETGSNDFKKRAGMNFSDFMDEVYDLLNNSSDTNKYSELAIATAQTMKTNNILTADIDKVDHWGLTPDNRLVILDYGYTDNVYKSHYGHGPGREQTFYDKPEPSMKVAKQKPFKPANVRPEDVRIGDTKNNVG